MKGPADTDAPASAIRGDVTAESRWDRFKKQCQLESTTKVSLSEQIKLERIPDEDLRLILLKYQSGTHLRVIHHFVQAFYEIEIECKTLARYWRRTLPGFREIEEQHREFRTAERALKKLTQQDISNET
jgi:hypothetical protein